VLRTLTIVVALAAASTAAAAPQKVVVRFTGEVNVDNAAAFTQAVAARRDQVVGVSISVGANSDAEFKTRHYLVGADNDEVYGQLLGLTAEEIGALARDGVI